MTKQTFYDQLTILPTSESIFLLTTFANMARCRLDNEMDFIEVVTGEIFEVSLAVHLFVLIVCVINFSVIFRLDALAKALSVIATATWLAGWLGGWVGVCHSRYCIKTTKPIRKRFGPSGRPII